MAPAAGEEEAEEVVVGQQAAERPDQRPGCSGQGDPDLKTRKLALNRETEQADCIQPLINQSQMKEDAKSKCESSGRRGHWPTADTEHEQKTKIRAALQAQQKLLNMKLCIHEPRVVPRDGVIQSINVLGDCATGYSQAPQR
jgi:hypothetical protein